MRRVLQPWEVTLRHGRGYQRARLAFLTFSVSLCVLLPLWHLRALEHESAGPGDSRWSTVAQLAPTSPPPFVGAPTSIRIGPLELVDPLEGFATGLMRGWSWALVWTLLPGVLLVALLGRFFCGWACPYLPVLALSISARRLLARLGFPAPDLRLPRHTALVVLVAVVLVGTVTGTQVVPLLYPPAVIGRAVFRAIFYGSLGSGAVLVLAAFLFDSLVSRAGFCRSVCPGGAMFTALATPSPLRVINERSKCTDCTVCDVVCNLGQSPMTQRLDSGCERCGKCIASCPTKALSWGRR